MVCARLYILFEGLEVLFDIIRAAVDLIECAVVVYRVARPMSQLHLCYFPYERREASWSVYVIHKVYNT